VWGYLEYAQRLNLEQYAVIFLNICLVLLCDYHHYYAITAFECFLISWWRFYLFFVYRFEPDFERKKKLMPRPSDLFFFLFNFLIFY